MNVNFLDGDTYCSLQSNEVPVPLARAEDIRSKNVLLKACLALFTIFLGENYFNIMCLQESYLLLYIPLIKQTLYLEFIFVPQKC